MSEGTTPAVALLPMLGATLRVVELLAGSLEGDDDDEKLVTVKSVLLAGPPAPVPGTVMILACGANLGLVAWWV